MEYSPILAVATAGFEILAGLWAFSLLWSRRPDGRRPMAPHWGAIATTGAILLLLAGYQITEVAICADVAAAGFLPRLAFIIVTWLPPLGLLLIAQLCSPGSRARYALPAVALATGAGVVAWIALDGSFAHASVCNAVYARYVHVSARFMWYGAYYWLGLFGMVATSAYALLRGRSKESAGSLAHVHLGTLGFVLPSLVVSYYVPATRHALPSVLCHFALILALALTHMLWELRAVSANVSELTSSTPEARI